MAEDDPYLYLEDRGSYRVHDFVSKANQMSLGALGDPTTGPTYEKILNSLRSDERIPFVSKMGTDDNGEAILYNFWKDSLKVIFLFLYSFFYYEGF
jgi:prolyl oligopeptidase PreP (S9A serine peptidase family)